MSARDALAAIRERAEAATEGPWKPGYDAGWTVDEARYPDGAEIAAMTDQEDEQGRVDAEFIAHARTDVPALVGALEAVLGVHQPVWTTDYHGNGYYRCGADDWTLDDQTPSCPTVTAIETALEGR